MDNYELMDYKDGKAMPCFGLNGQVVFLTKDSSKAFLHNLIDDIKNGRVKK